MNYKAWLIDLDGTLYNPTPVKLAMAVGMLTAGARAIRVIRVFRKEHERLREERSTTNSFELQLERAADRLSLSTDEVRNTVLHWMFKRPGFWLRTFRRRSLIDAIRQFRENGGVTAIVSDYPASEKLAAMGIRDLFDVVVANGEPNGPESLKPSPHGYNKAASILGFGPEDCLVIGDREDADGIAARFAGMHFCHVKKFPAGLSTSDDDHEAASTSFSPCAASV